MGDRSLVTFKRDGYYSPVVYQHNGGHGIVKMIKAAAPHLRDGDPSYSAARFCGLACQKSPGSHLGVGIFDAPTAADIAEGFKEFSHGDAGIIVIDADTGECRAYAGYLAEDPETAVFTVARPPK